MGTVPPPPEKYFQNENSPYTQNKNTVFLGKNAVSGLLENCRSLFIYFLARGNSAQVQKRVSEKIPSFKIQLKLFGAITFTIKNAFDDPRHSERHQNPKNMHVEKLGKFLIQILCLHLIDCFTKIATHFIKNRL